MTYKQSVGDSLVLPCNVTGLPQPKLEWVRCGVNMSESESSTNSTEESSIYELVNNNTTAELRLIDMRVQDTGVYVCIASYLDVTEYVEAVNVIVPGETQMLSKAILLMWLGCCFLL